MTTIEILMLISSMLGGLALFLSGMSTMSDSLAAMTGGRGSGVPCIRKSATSRNS